MKWSKFWHIISPVIKNKYFIALLFFVTWLGIFDQNNLIERYKLSSRIDKLEKQKHHYLEEIEQNKRKMEELQSDPKNLEKFAREEYLMKKKDEVIFVVVEE
ncbi:septum formation initiator family protein [Marinilabiliaceae bacterium JC017]|nr:septum formation initiator family protein [Marinilabiliaceae bacterium JC017]